MQGKASSGACPTLGVIGATSLVGACLLPLLTDAGEKVVAYSRKTKRCVLDGVEWCELPATGECSRPAITAHGDCRIGRWIIVAPIWVLPEHFPLLEDHGARRIVALSSTSRFTKQESSIPEEQALAQRLAEAEERLQGWAASRGVEWIILRPTLIYGRGRDKNVSEIARFIARFGFFPLLGKAAGARQPVHAEDVAVACFAASHSAVSANRAYNLSGGETLSYREMVVRVFVALQRRPRLITVPMAAFRSVVAGLRLLPRYRHWTAGMAERMNEDLVFAHADAARDLGFVPRPFTLTRTDLPQ